MTTAIWRISAIATKHPLPKEHANTRILLWTWRQQLTHVLNLEIILNEYYIKTIVADLSLVRIMQLSRGLNPHYSSQNSDSKVNANPCLVNIRCIFSMNEWTYGRVTTPLDFSCALSFLDLSFLMLFSVHLLFDLLYRPMRVTTCMEGCSYVFFLLFTVFFFWDNAVTRFQ